MFWDFPDELREDILISLAKHAVDLFTLHPLSLLFGFSRYTLCNFLNPVVFF